MTETSLQPMPMPQEAQPPNPQLIPGCQLALGPGPSSVKCPSCGISVMTTVVKRSTTKTHLMALLLCCLCPIAMCVPYCMASCQNADHSCPSCGTYLGTYQR